MANQFGPRARHERQRELARRALKRVREKSDAHRTLRVDLLLAETDEMVIAGYEQLIGTLYGLDRDSFQGDDEAYGDAVLQIIIGQK